MQASANALVSSDSHVCEPPDLWMSRLGGKYGSRVPHVGKNAGSGVYGDWTGKLGGDWFVVEGIPAFPMVFGTLGPYQAAERGRRLGSFDFTNDAKRSAYDTSARLVDMDADGVTAEVIYPSYLPRMLFMRDAELQRACVAVYNDWVLDFCAPAPDRLLPMAAISLVDPLLAVDELHRCLKRGAKGATIWASPPASLPFSSSHYERFWAAAEEANVPVSLHALPPLDAMIASPRAKSPFVENAAMGLIEDFHLANVLFDHHIQRSLTQLLLSGVLERFPRLRLIVCEFGTAWLPLFLDNIDGTYAARPDGLSLKSKPSEYFHRQIWTTFDRGLGLSPEATARHEDRLLWASDFPHVESSWPDSRGAFLRDCGHLSASAQQKVGLTNFRELYSIPAP